MYILATQIKGLPVISLQTGQPIAVIAKPLVNQTNMEIVALECSIGRFQKNHGVVLMRDIRQFARDCVVIDSFEEIEDAGEIVRLRDVVEQNFDPINKTVVNESGDKLGRVDDYTINLKTYMLQKLYVHQSLMKSIIFNNLVIDRTQIIEVTPKQFTVRDATIPKASLASQPIP
jgi:uncharacterized protein YrrD